MKPRPFFHLMFFAVLALTACTPSIPVVAEEIPTPKADQMQSEAKTDPDSSQDIEGKCLRNTGGTRLLINMVAGYCLQYPTEYDVAFLNPNEVMLFKNSILNTSEPSLHINVQPASEMTIEQAADKIVEVYAIPGMEAPRVEMTIGGEKAIMLDGLSGQDPNRQVVVLHNDSLYTLFFIQMDKDQPELVAQAEALYDTVVASFNFRPETNLCPDCPSPPDAVVDQPQGNSQNGMISGWVWHDLCDSGKDGELPPEATPHGCVEDVSALGTYHADGVMATNESLIEGAVVSLGEGACPSTDLAEVSTIVTDLSYSFSGLEAGTYCISIDPQREPNISILRPGVWTYPAVSQDVISTTVTLAAGEYRGMVNFGWDYQFEP